MILLVEDDEDVRELLELTLRGRGYVVESVTGGSAALASLERVRPCLIILDMVMPRVTGWDVLAAMKQRDLADIPVCVISAITDSRPTNAVATLGKPFDVKELVTIAAKYCTHASRG